MCNTPSLSFNGWTYVAFSDLCGFKAMMKNREEAYKGLDYLFKSVYGLLRDKQSIKGLAVSDCVISWATDEQLQSVVDFVGALHKKMIHKQYLMRTSIACGQFEFQDRIQLTNLSKQMIWGGAYLAAYLGNESVKPGSIGLLGQRDTPNIEESLYHWRWKRRSSKNGILHEYYWAASKQEDINRIKEVQRLRKKQEQYEGLKELYNSLVSSGPAPPPPEAERKQPTIRGEHMKDKRGKKGKYLVSAEKGLVKDSAWKPILKDYPVDLVCSIREQLLEKVPGLTEKFNTNSRYFGYWTGTNEDRAYIYVQKEELRIDLHISQDLGADLQKAGFEVRFTNNFQGQAHWLTGWRVPHITKDIKTVIIWLLKAFNDDK